MTINPSIDVALDQVKQALTAPVSSSDIEAGWDDQHCLSWLEAVRSIERYVGGNKTERGFSIVRSLDSHGSDTMDHPRGRTLMNLAAVLRQNDIDHYA